MLGELWPLPNCSSARAEELHSPADLATLAEELHSPAPPAAATRSAPKRSTLLPTTLGSGSAWLTGAAPA